MDGCQEGDPGHGESTREAGEDMMAYDIESITAQSAFGAVSWIKPHENIQGWT